MSLTPFLTFGTMKEANIRSSAELASAVRANDRIQVIFPSEAATANPEDVYLSGESHNRTSKRPEVQPFYMTVSSWVNELALFSEVAVSTADRREIAVGLAAQLSMQKLEVEFVRSMDDLSELVGSQIHG
jgi:hypothetical protein